MAPFTFLENKMATALDKFIAGMQTKYGSNSAMKPTEMPDKGIVSTGSLAIDYMVSSERGFGVPRDIVWEIGGAPGCGKSTLSMNVVNNILNYEFERAKKKVRLEKAVRNGDAPKESLDWFSKFFDNQSYDLHVFAEQELNKLIDEYDLDDKDIDHAIKDVMRNALYCDIEGRFDQHWAANFIDDRWLENKFAIMRPNTIENATTMYVEALRTGMFGVAVIDSIGGAPTERTFWKDAESGNVGGNALGVTRFAGFAQNMSSKFTCLTIGIQQVREDLSGYHQYLVPGGVAWKHACSLRMELKRKNKEVVYDLEPGTVDQYIQVGYGLTARLHKNSVGLSGREAHTWFYTFPSKYGEPGFDKIQDVIRLATLSGVIVKGASGVYQSDLFPNGRIRGYDKMAGYIKDNEDVYKKVEADMKTKLMHGDIKDFVSNFEDEGNIDPETGELKA